MLAALRLSAHSARTAAFAGCTAWILPCALGWADPLGQAGGFDLRWDNTVRETLGFRDGAADPALLSNMNQDDGDRAFRPGLMSARLDVYSELTGTRGNFGFDLSAQGWYDPLYFQGSANNSPQTFNQLHVSNTQFPASVRTLMGKDVEVVNAFVRDRFDVADLPVSIRLGRQTLLWGESLFFAENGIAAGQAPVDGIKAATAPLAEARELYLPVTKAVVRIELQPGLALEASDHFEWRRDWLPGVDSYFSTTDILDTGGHLALLPNGRYLYRTSDSEPHGLGQFGAALRLQTGEVDYGLYALRYDAKLPEPVFDSAQSTYHLVFPRGIDIMGASASTYLGESNIAGEISWRHNTPLAAGDAGLTGAGADSLYGGGGAYAFAAAAIHPRYLAALPAVAPSNPAAMGGYATGDSWHAQISAVAQLPPSRLWQGASLATEIAANDLLEVTDGRAFVLTGRTHFAASLRSVFTPSYFQVLPGLDISVPLGVGYTPIGRSSLESSQNAGSGNLTAGVSAIYRTVWQAALSYTQYVGGAGQQPLADRNFALISVTRSF